MQLDEVESNLITKVEFNELKKIVVQIAEARMNLAEAQRKTEERLNELTKALQETEERLNELAKVQKRIKEKLCKLVKEHRKTGEMLGTLQHTVRYVLEKDLGIKVVPNTFVKVNICKKFVAGGKFSYKEACFIKKAN